MDIEIEFRIRDPQLTAEALNDLYAQVGWNQFRTTDNRENRTNAIHLTPVRKRSRWQPPRWFRPDHQRSLQRPNPGCHHTFPIQFARSQLNDYKTPEREIRGLQHWLNSL